MTEPATQKQIDGSIELFAQEQLYYARSLADPAVGLPTLLEPAVPDSDPVAPTQIRSAALAFVLGLFLIYGLLLLRDSSNTRLRDSNDLSKVTGLPVLSELPRLHGGARGLPREGSSYLRTYVMFATTDEHPEVLQVTSPEKAEGKSSAALSLAETCFRNDHRRLLVDVDLRKPVIGLENGLRPGTPESLRTWLEHPSRSHTPARAALGSDTTLDIGPSYEADGADEPRLPGGAGALPQRVRRDRDRLRSGAALVEDVISLHSSACTRLLDADVDQDRSLRTPRSWCSYVVPS